MVNRRQFIKKLLFALAFMIFRPIAYAKPVRKPMSNAKASVFRALNGSPEDNLLKVLDMMDGVRNYWGVNDIVIIKPNVQWWNQGAPNLSSLKTFVDMIMNQPGGFYGEVIIAENSHGGATPWKHGGWVNPFIRNSSIMEVHNYNELSMYLKKSMASGFLHAIGLM